MRRFAWMALTVACQRDPEVRYVQVPTRQPTIAEPVRPPNWWCANALDVSLAWCERVKDECETKRLFLIAKGTPYGTCEPMIATACFRWRSAGGGAALACSPTIPLCRWYLDYWRNNKPEAPVLSGCEVTE